MFIGQLFSTVSKLGCISKSIQNRKILYKLKNGPETVKLKPQFNYNIISEILKQQSDNAFQ